MTVPPAWNPLVRVAESVTLPPVVIPLEDNAAVIVGVALLTVTMELVEEAVSDGEP